MRLPTQLSIAAAVAAGVVISMQLIPERDDPLSAGPEAHSPSVARDADPSTSALPTDEPVVDAQMAVDAIDWSHCLDDVGTPECAAVVDGRISQTLVDGMSWEERFGRFAEDVLRVDAALADPTCDLSGWTPELAARCVPDAFYNIAVLLDACPHGTANAMTENQLAHLNRDGLLSDLGQLDQFATANRFSQLQNTWLRERCKAIVGEKVEVNLGDVKILTDELHVERGDHAWATYIQRATLLGEPNAAEHFLTATKQTLEPFKPGDLDVLGDNGRSYSDWIIAARAALKRNVDAWEGDVRPVVEEILQRDPATGYKLLAQLEVERYPELERVDHLQQHPDDEDIYPLIPNDDPELIERAENIVVYKLAAMKHEGTDLDNLDDTTIEFMRRTDEALTYAFLWADEARLHTLIARADALGSP